MIEFSSYVAPACLPKKSNRVTSTFRGNHCEIAGWGMQVSVIPWRCGYIVCDCILCTRSTTTPAAIRPPSGRQRLRFPSPHHLIKTLPFNTDTDHSHSFSLLSVLFERLEQCETASATRSMDETLQGLENSAQGEKLTPVRWSKLKIITSLILFYWAPPDNIFRLDPPKFSWTGPPLSVGIIFTSPDT